MKQSRLSGRRSPKSEMLEWRKTMRCLIASLLVLAAFLIFEGCDKSFEPRLNDSESYKSGSVADIRESGPENEPLEPATPLDIADLVSVAVGDESLTLWPYTGADFSGQGQDPVNLIFYGEADPRDIMQALMSLDGNRSEFPPVPPFNSLWEDAIGDVQTAYADSFGWRGGTVQLACGDYEQVRFHIRLFRFGAWTLGNAHFEVLIPGTTDHQVLSWELAEQFVVADFLRSGLLDPVTPIIETDQINASPFRTIPAMIYNGLPVELRVIIGGPTGDVTEDVPIATDGHAIILNLASRIPCQPDYRVDDFVINFNQVIPKPFCSGPMDYLYVNGPVHMRQVVQVTSAGRYSVSFKASADLIVTPIDAFSGEPIGESLNARVTERHSGMITDERSVASSTQHQRLYPMSLPGAGWLFSRLRANSKGASGYCLLSWCADEPDAAASPGNTAHDTPGAKLTISDAIAGSD